MSTGLPNTPAPNAETTAVHAHRLAVNASWLLRLRWVAVTGQMVAIAAAYMVLPDSIRVWPLMSIVVLTAATNALLAYSTKELRVNEFASDRSELILAAVMVLDLVLLTLLLMYSGGPYNPFALFYLVNLALAAVLLPRQWSWPLGLVGILCLAMVCVWYQPIAELQNLGPTVRSDRIPLYQFGFFIAIVACAAVIVYFVTRVTGELQMREMELQAAEIERVRAQRLEGLATLAAGAGHELASPLSTIAVVANELERHLAGSDAPTAVLEDIQLIRTELARCRQILNRMSADAGQVAGDQLRKITLGEVVEATLHGLPYREQITIHINDQDRTACVFAPLQGLAQALRAVTQNAHDASPVTSQSTIHLSARQSEGRVVIEVRDQGEGMAAEVIRRAGEPFFTTKEPGQGTGLGLFLTRSVIERLGGKLAFESTAGVGTTVQITLPRA